MSNIGPNAERLLAIESSLASICRTASIIELIDIMHKTMHRYDQPFIDLVLGMLGYNTYYSIPLMQMMAVTNFKTTANAINNNYIHSSMLLTDACRELYNAKYLPSSQPIFSTYKPKIAEIFIEDGSYIVNVSNECLEFETVLGLERFIKNEKLSPIWVGNEDDKPNISVDWTEEDDRDSTMVTGTFLMNGGANGLTTNTGNISWVASTTAISSVSCKCILPSPLDTITK